VFRVRAGQFYKAPGSAFCSKSVREARERIEMLARRDFPYNGIKMVPAFCIPSLV
jgi:hypothetical protein